MRRVLRDLWSYVRDAPTGLPTILLGLSVLGLGLVQGSGSAAAFLWPSIAGCGLGVMLAIEFRASAAGTAGGIGAILAVISEYALFDILNQPLTGSNLVLLAVTSGSLAAGPGWLLMILARGRDQGGDRYVLLLLPLILLMVAWSLGRS